MRRRGLDVSIYKSSNNRTRESTMELLYPLLYTDVTRYRRYLVYLGKLTYSSYASTKYQYILIV